MLATIDVLGEEIAHADEARAIARAYLDVFDAIERERLEANVSVKLTALGLELSYELCRENLLAVLAQGASCASTWRTRRRPTRPCASTASCARRGMTTSASSCRRISAVRSETSAGSPT